MSVSLFSFDSQDQVNEQLYRENAELKVRIEFLEQSLYDATNGLYPFRFDSSHV